MASKVRNTPAPTPVTPPKFSFAGLSAEDTGESISKIAGNPFRALDGTPFEQWITETRASGTAKRVTVPTDEAAKRVVYLLRLAARKLGAGVRIPTPYETTNDGQVRVTFQGKDRATHDPNKLRKPSKPRKNETEQSFRARVAAWEAQSGQTWTPKS